MLICIFEASLPLTAKGPRWNQSNEYNGLSSTNYKSTSMTKQLLNASITHLRNRLLDWQPNRFVTRASATHGPTEKLKSKVNWTAPLAHSIVHLTISHQTWCEPTHLHHSARRAVVFRSFQCKLTLKTSKTWLRRQKFVYRWSARRRVILSQAVLSSPRFYTFFSNALLTVTTLLQKSAGSDWINKNFSAPAWKESVRPIKALHFGATNY